MQRIQATLFHHGVHGTPETLRTGEGGAFLERLTLPADARERIQVELAMIDAIEAQLAPLDRELRRLARRQTGCKALMGLYGMGELTLLVTLCELGDVPHHLIPRPPDEFAPHARHSSMRTTLPTSSRSCCGSLVAAVGVAP